MTAAHRRLSSVTLINDDIDCPAHSLMLSFHDLSGQLLRRLPSTKPCGMIFDSVVKSLYARSSEPHSQSINQSTNQPTDRPTDQPTNQSINQSINQSKPVTPRRRWGTPTDAFAATAAHRRLSSATWSNDDIDWPVHSLMLFFHD